MCGNEIHWLSSLLEREWRLLLRSKSGLKGMGFLFRRDHRARVVLASVFTATVALAGCSGPTIDPSEVLERCDNQLDDNGNGLIDCADAACALFPTCQASGGEHCYNGIDDNGDGKIDCADDACSELFLCSLEVEDCVNGRDDDNDGDIDCADDACANTVACTPDGENCSNGLDDDNDGDIDCADADCASVFVCLVPFERPGNMIDDDGDGRIDCEDDEYARTALCADAAEDCSNNQDDDGDGTIDCADADCSLTFSCLVLAEDCTNGVDDNGDGDVDCDDLRCQGHVACEGEFCLNLVDDDGDGLDDCDDPDCAAFLLPACLGARPDGGQVEDGELCSDGLDNDSNGLTDCEEMNCVDEPACAEVCDNDADDDADGQTDCEDADCADAPECQPVEICDNGVDDDGDDESDCADADCAAAVNCQEDTAEACSDELDNDLDGAIDCQESSCHGTSACAEATPELCSDGLDTDGDGDADCADSGCAGLADVCVEATCTNGDDDDNDGDVDCADADCAADPACDESTQCDDDRDNDGDNQIDCQDDDCSAFPACQDDVCDGMDNDQDGVTDENCACYTHPAGEFGVCASSFIDEISGECVANNYEVDESTCDGLDNDCDGTTDEGCACDVNGSTLGVCAAGGVIAAGTGECVAGPDYNAEDQCDDSLDNDCNGAVNDGCQCDIDGSTQGVCANGGRISPLDGSCIAGVDYNLEDQCDDALDNDCDGVVNNDCPCDYLGSSHGVCATATIDSVGTCAMPVGYSVMEQCGDDLDNNCDGFVDEGCSTPNLPSCADVTAGSALGAMVYTGTTSGASSDLDGTCHTNYDAEEFVVAWTAPSDGTFIFSLAGSSFDTVLYALDDTCQQELVCNDDTHGLTSEVRLTLDAGDTIALVVDAYDSSISGSFELSVGESEECDNSRDDDLDGDIDCDDSDCSTSPRCNVEVCDNLRDDDHDALIDCEDPACSSEPHCAPAATCPQLDFGSGLGQLIYAGTTANASNDHSGSCGFSHDSAPELAGTWTAPHDGQFEFTTEGSSFNTLLYIRDGGSTCSGAELACNDNHMIGPTWSKTSPITLSSGQTVTIFIDGRHADSGAFRLGVIDVTGIEFCANGVDDDADGDIDCDDADCANEVVCARPARRILGEIVNFVHTGIDLDVELIISGFAFDIDVVGSDRMLDGVLPTGAELEGNNPFFTDVTRPAHDALIDVGLCTTTQNVITPSDLRLVWVGAIRTLFNALIPTFDARLAGGFYEIDQSDTANNTGDLATGALFLNRVYANKAGTISITMTCTDDGNSYPNDAVVEVEIQHFLELEEGWNLVWVKIPALGTSSTAQMWTATPNRLHEMPTPPTGTGNPADFYPWYMQGKP